jgi:hypothetical protein
LAAPLSGLLSANLSAVIASSGDRHRTVQVNIMVTLHPSEEAFFFVQDAAEAAAEATVNRLPQGKGTVAALCIGTAVAGVAYVVTRPRVKKAVKELLGLTKD